ncbi:hypothetical protein PMAYCL1PPCAC_00519 [Pristionchus mayeri]|uniref:Uncharacterized protein n=1 Tax=Pristionchus mayeri TaxID=1317129 RepID=A0AAN4YZ05_9BILA|nr:hypothetical protein PMAYCL1PPCAC_00519 [Pristionchus mayeri]
MKNYTLTTRYILLLLLPLHPIDCTLGQGNMRLVELLLSPTTMFDRNPFEASVREIVVEEFCPESSRSAEEIRRKFGMVVEHNMRGGCREEAIDECYWVSKFLRTIIQVHRNASGCRCNRDDV